MHHTHAHILFRNAAQAKRMDRMESELVLIIGQPAGRTLYSRWRVSVWFCLGMIGWISFFSNKFANLFAVQNFLLVRLWLFTEYPFLSFFFFFCGALVSGILDRYSLF